MNLNSLLVGCLLLASSSITSAAPAVAADETKQPPSCGAWVVHREKSDTLTLANSSWLMGYLTGVAMSGGKDYLSGTDNVAIYKWMDDYCRKNPLMNLSSGGDALAAELRSKKGTAK